MIIHIIYHIPGRKVGCTRDLTLRKLWYKVTEGKIPSLDILEKLHDKTDKEAGDIEWAWADKFGYRRWGHYVETLEWSSLPGSIRNRTHEQYVEDGRKGGNQTVELGVGLYGLSREDRLRIGRNAGKLGGRRTAELGHGTFQTMLREELQNLSREAGRKGGQTGASGRRQAELGTTPYQRKSICIHCGLECNLANIIRWHDGNCKKRPMVRRT
jgi:general stress protein YciG